MYLITSTALVEDIIVHDYKLACLIARALYKELNVKIYVSELVTNLDGTPALLAVARYE